MDNIPEAVTGRTRTHNLSHLSPHSSLEARQREHGSCPTVGVDGRVSVEGLFLLRLLAEDLQQILLGPAYKQPTYSETRNKVMGGGVDGGE